MFAKDRDLLALEPTLFRDIGWAGQRLVKGVGSIADLTLTFSTQDILLDYAGITPGAVVVVGGAAYEVTDQFSSTELLISRLRPNESDPPLYPTPATDQPAHVTTFAPQIAAIHAALLRALDLEPGATPSVETPAEANITNPGDLARVEAAGALYLIYSAAAALSGPDSPAGRRADHYRSIYATERRHARAQIDLDNDGHPDSTRTIATPILTRG